MLLFMLPFLTCIYVIYVKFHLTPIELIEDKQNDASKNISLDFTNMSAEI